MAKSKDEKTEYREGINEAFKEILKVISLDDIVFVEKLEGDARRDLCKFCHDAYHSPFFEMIIKNFIHTQVMFTADQAINGEQYWGGKMLCQGVFTVRDFYKKYSTVWETEYSPSTEKFDRHASFSKAKV